MAGAPRGSTRAADTHAETNKGNRFMQTVRHRGSLITDLRMWVRRRRSRKLAERGYTYILHAFGAFQVLVAGVKLGLFDLLDAEPGRTTEEIRDRMEIPDHSARALMLSCAALGLVDRDPSGAHRNSPFIAQLMSGRQREEFLPYLEAFHSLMYQPFFHLTDCLRQGTNTGLQYFPGPGDTLYDRMESHAKEKLIFHAWMKSLKASGRRIPDPVVDALKSSRHLADVGGGDASNAIEAAGRLPQIQITICDLPGVCELATANAAQAGMGERIGVHPGNFIDTPLPAGLDAVMFAHIFNIYSDETNQALVKKAADALPAGGTLVVYNLTSRDDQMGSWHAGFMALYFQVLATGTGFVYPSTSYETWFRNAGFSALSIHSDPYSGEGIFIGTK